MPQSVNVYIAPITLGFTPADGDLIRGTVNGVEVSGKWAFNGADLFDSSNKRICSVGFNGPQSVLVVHLPSAPTTDYELHLYRYTPEGIVQIPQRYVDGLEEITANANQALETATAAQNAVEKRLMVYGKSTETTVTIESLGAKTTATQQKNLGALNIENGSRISFVASDLYRDEVVWNGSSIYFSLRRENGTFIGRIGFWLRPDGTVEIVNYSDENLTNVVITYRKIEVANKYYSSMTSGVWLPPYLCCSCIYLVSSKPKGNGYPVYKITVDDTGTISATEVT